MNKYLFLVTTLFCFLFMHQYASGQIVYDTIFTYDTTFVYDTVYVHDTISAMDTISEKKVKNNIDTTATFLKNDIILSQTIKNDSMKQLTFISLMTMAFHMLQAKQAEEKPAPNSPVSLHFDAGLNLYWIKDNDYFVTNPVTSGYEMGISVQKKLFKRFYLNAGIHFLHNNNSAKALPGESDIDTVSIQYMNWLNEHSILNYNSQLGIAANLLFSQGKFSFSAGLERRRKINASAADASLIDAGFTISIGYAITDKFTLNLLYFSGYEWQTSDFSATAISHYDYSSSGLNKVYEVRNLGNPSLVNRNLSLKLSYQLVQENPKKKIFPFKLVRDANEN